MAHWDLTQDVVVVGTGGGGMTAALVAAQAGLAVLVVEKPPFYAVQMVAGDLGTKGGLVMDEHARVLREDGSVIEGLYVAGNNSASVMGNTYPGARSTIGPSMTFGYIAAKHIAGGRIRPVGELP